MPIPAFDQYGLLPAGIHQCSLQDIEGRFCWNQHRYNLYNGFRAFEAVLRADFVQPLYFDGSFVTDKAIPDDTDVILDMLGCPDPLVWQAVGFMALHQPRLQQQHGVHFWVNIPGGNDFRAYFQYLGLKSAKLKGLPPTHSKGILHIV